MARAETPLAGLAAHVRSFGRVPPAAAPSRACMLVKTLLETPNDDPVLRRVAEDMMRATEAAFADAFRAAQDSGVIDPGADAGRLASRLQAQIFGLRAYAQRTDAAGRIAELCDDVATDIERLAIPA